MIALSGEDEETELTLQNQKAFMFVKLKKDAGIVLPDELFAKDHSHCRENIMRSFYFLGERRVTDTSSIIQI